MTSLPSVKLTNDQVKGFLSIAYNSGYELNDNFNDHNIVAGLLADKGFDQRHWYDQDGFKRYPIDDLNGLFKMGILKKLDPAAPGIDGGSKKRRRRRKLLKRKPSLKKSKRKKSKRKKSKRKKTKRKKTKRRRN